MDLQVRKRHFIQEFLGINNEKLLDRLEDVLKSERKKENPVKLKPLSLEELNRMIDRAEDDARNNRLTNVHKLVEDIKSWT
jgi:hypothetical protein